MILMRIVFIFFFFVFSGTYLYPVSSSSNIKLSQTDSISRGRILFSVQHIKSDTSKTCNSCHIVPQTDTFNWNPDLFELAHSVKKMSYSQFEEIFILPLTKKLFESHQYFTTNPDTLAFIKAYLDHITDKPTNYQKDTNYNFSIFLAILFVLSLVFFQKNRKVKIVLISLIVISLSIYFYFNNLKLGLQEGYEPVQPVKFSHSAHAGQNKIECLYCHISVKYGKNAGIPAVSICMNCHSAVIEGSNSGSFEINKVIRSNSEKKSISWVRVNNLPAHVHFNHQVHFNTAGIKCEQCHGWVSENHRIRQEMAFSMKWCTDCHNKSFIKTKGNNYYASYKAIDSILFIKEAGGSNCINCHH
jgi:hypothetical protein